MRQEGHARRVKSRKWLQDAQLGARLSAGLPVGSKFVHTLLRVSGVHDCEKACL